MAVIQDSVNQARGHVDPAFEPVAREVERVLGARGEDGLAVAAYVEGKKVVDLWTGTADGGRPWAEDTLSMIFSCTKGTLALSAQILSDRGLLDIDAPVTRYWPEYGVNGKENTTVRHLLTHQAGVLTFPRYWEVLAPDYYTNLADWDLMTRSLAAAPPSYEPGSSAFYHALTIGHLVGEVIRRIDGRTPGRFFDEEVAQPLGLDLYIGVPQNVAPRVATVHESELDASNLTPEQLRVKEVFAQMTLAARDAVRAGKAIEMDALLYSIVFTPPERESQAGYLAEMMNNPVIRAAELPGGNGVSDARSLARMYAMLAEGGTLDGVRIVSPESIERFNTVQVQMVGTATPAVCLTYHRMTDQPGPSETAFGHGGAGGSLGFADPERRVSFGFVHNRMRNEPLGTASDLCRAVYACL